MDRFSAFALVLAVATLAAYFKDLVRLARSFLGLDAKAQPDQPAAQATGAAPGPTPLRSVPLPPSTMDGGEWPRLLELAFRDLASADERRYERARLIVASWPGSETIDELIALLHASSSVLRARACDLLYRVGDERAMGPVYEYLSHSSAGDASNDEGTTDSRDDDAPASVRASLGDRAPSAMLRKAA